MQRQNPEHVLPIKPVELLILTMLMAGERHGYGIRQDIIAHTQGAMQLEAPRRRQPATATEGAWAAISRKEGGRQ